MTEEQHTDTKKTTNRENTVFVGNKPVMNYVLAVVTQFNSGQGSVNIEARGRAISKAVDVAEIVKHRFMNSAKVGTIDIGTEEMNSKDNRQVNVSTIRIALNK